MIRKLPEDKANTHPDISKPEKDISANSHIKTDRVIPVIKETSEDSDSTPTNTSQSEGDSSVISIAKTGSSKANLEIPVIRETPRALYSVNTLPDYLKTKRDSASIEIDTSQLKRDSAESGAQDPETGKCKRGRFLREASPEGVLVPIVRTEHADPGTKIGFKEGEADHFKIASGDSSSRTQSSSCSSVSSFPPSSSSTGPVKCPDEVL